MLEMLTPAWLPMHWSHLSREQPTTEISGNLPADGNGCAECAVDKNCIMKNVRDRDRERERKTARNRKRGVGRKSREGNRMRLEGSSAETPKTP